MAARHDDLHEDERPRPFGVVFQQSLDREETLLDALRVVETVGREQDLPPAVRGADLLDTARDLG